MSETIRARTLLPAGSSRRRNAFAWGILGTLLLVNLLLAAFAPRDRWPAMVGDEATYAMQAASLAWDFDLAYEREDFDRFVELYGRVPDGLILQSRDGGERITFSKPMPYAAAIAPFVRIAPVRGPLVANALFLILAAVGAGLTLERRLGVAAPLWVAAFVFASVAFAYTFWIHADLFLMCAVAGALALAWAGEGPEADGVERYRAVYRSHDGRSLVRWLAVGALLGIAVAFRPFYLALALPAALAVTPRRDGGRPWASRLALVVGLLVILAATAGVSRVSGGGWSSYGGERQGFYGTTGFPEVDFPASEWGDSVRRWGNTSWIHSQTLDFEADPRLWAWNTVYFLVGRNVGVLPYFLPLLLGLLAFRPDRGRWALLVAVALVVAAFFLLRPFNFYGGGGAIANRYFLPVYPAFWFLAARPVRGIWAVVAAAAAAPFLVSLWLAPTAFPQVELERGGVYRHVTPVARQLLPYETSQSHIPGGRDVHHNGLWIKFLGSGVGPRDEGRSLVLDPATGGTLLFATDRPLPAVQVAFGADAPGDLVVQGGERGRRYLTADGGVVHEVLLDGPFRRHPMWWTWDDVYLYRLRLGFPEPEADAPPRPSELGFRMAPVDAVARSD